MPNCFQLIRKTTGQAEKFSVIDNEICAHLGVQPHPVYYHNGWYDSIGLSIACGKTIPQLIEQTQQDIAKDNGNNDYYVTHLAILNYLSEHFVSNAWYEVSKPR